MMQTIKLTSEQMRMMSLFQKVTKSTARDCIEDEKKDRIIFVVDVGKMGLAIGRGGANIKSLKNMIKRNIELVEFHENPEEFLKNMLNSELVHDVKVTLRPDGTKQAMVTVEAGKKGIVVGREGRNAEKARLLVKRYFDIGYVMINSPSKQLLE
ncbi:MAG: NusA-like transcription termination signal-binding factor [Cenarchaeum sp. SB0665_bin_23]|nr:NusA-like transcription termination signal-binding factor [Cenarchaeum sp. SB0667_bin_13]MXY60620.1 NusA-like transcription termination signal-binding factor [Cenarchaeum sp. SB0665_bin_23]MXZ94011.1 NusA-like transcription termination signal-binding factor [Cenarchaeum sp. SB0666_bin_15]MYB46972.1 NusA-like transcription termination signal-binding factor [Cenarchaeum sp. SB0662_bin_33]MYC79538.1 NusA-like transcription termination signal-binding factor [Cenarchaeum sp. SB0661_bin_35]MYD589